MLNYIKIASPVGDLLVIANETHIVALYPQTHIKYNIISDNLIEKENNILLQAKQQLNQYFLTENYNFTLPFALVGTDFQKIVWYELLKISYGTTISYGDVAKKINNSKAVRAVAGTIAKNPVSIIIPCHRVISANGKMTGYAGGIEMKEWLLKHEEYI